MKNKFVYMFHSTAFSLEQALSFGTKIVLTVLVAISNSEGLPDRNIFTLLYLYKNIHMSTFSLCTRPFAAWTALTICIRHAQSEVWPSVVVLVIVVVVVVVVVVAVVHSVTGSKKWSTSRLKLNLLLAGRHEYNSNWRGVLRHTRGKGILTYYGMSF